MLKPCLKIVFSFFVDADTFHLLSSVSQSVAVDTSQHTGVECFVSFEELGGLAAC